MGDVHHGNESWTNHDNALWFACEIALDLSRGHAPRHVPDVLAPFPPPAPDHSFWASGYFQLFDFRPLGDGSYVRDEGFFFATGSFGLAATAATAMCRAFGNSSRRRAALEAAQPRWTLIGQGYLYLAPSAFVMHVAEGLWEWSYGSVRAAQVVAPGSVHFQGQSERGPISWVLVSDWAELLFITWALRYHPRHPQLLDGGWLPPGWLQSCAAHGYRTRMATPVISAT